MNYPIGKHCHYNQVRATKIEFRLIIAKSQKLSFGWISIIFLGFFFLFSRLCSFSSVILDGCGSLGWLIGSSRVQEHVVQLEGSFFVSLSITSKAGSFALALCLRFLHRNILCFVGAQN